MQIINKKAQFNYNILDKFEAGIELKGGEVKTIREGYADISGSHAKFIGNELFLINANIPSLNSDANPTRIRKLLLHKGELLSIGTKIKAKKLTVVPVSLYTKGRLIKVKLALAKTKRMFERKESLKKKDLEREIEKSLSERYKSKL